MATLIDDATATRYFNEIDNAPEDERQLMADSLIAWGNAKQEQEYNATDEHFSKLFTDESYFEQEKQSNSAVQESLDPDQTAKSAAIGAWLEHRMGRPIDTMSYQAERDAYAMANYGKKNLDDAQFFDFVRGEYDWQKKKTEAINDLQMQAVAKAINDSQLGQNRPFVDGMTEVFNEWQAKYPELVDGQNDAAFLSQGYKLYNDTINDLDTVRPQASKALSTLTAFTQGSATDEELQSLANDFVGAPPEDRQKIYKYVTLAAQAGQIDRAGLEQFAVNMGQAFTRGFDFVPQGTLQMQEAGVNNWLESIRNGTQIWVPVNGDLTKAVVGNAPAGVESDAWRQATLPETETLIQSGHNVRESFKVVRELRNVAKTGVDPIRPVLEEDTFWGTAERGAYGLAGSIPLMGATAVNPYLGVLAYQATEYDRIMLENPDIDPQFAQGLALVEGAANAAIDRVQLSSLSGKLPMFGRYLDRIKSDGIRRTIKIGANVFEQNVQEGAQDLIAPVLETAVAALREDMPDKDFTKLMDEWAGQRAETFFATLPLSLIGGGIATYQDIKNPSAELNATKLRQVGFDKEQTTFIQRAENPEEYTARIQMEWDKRTPENIEAGRQEVIAEMQQAATPDENSAKLSETVAEDGTRRWLVTAPDGKELLQTQDQQAALDAIAQHGHAQILNKQFEALYEPQELRQMITDLSTQWTSQDSNNKLIEEEQGMNAQQKLEQLQAAGNTAQIQELHNRIANSPIKDTPYDQINILGEASVDDVAEMVFQPLIKINPNTRPENLREEIHHTAVKVAIKNGSVTLDTLRGWLDATEKALPGTFQNLVRDSEGDIVESLAQVQAAYENGKINADEETKLPPSFIGYIKNMMRTLAEVMRRAVALRGAFKDGALPAEYETFLADSVGLNQQARVDTARERVGGELTQGNFNYSIGSMSERIAATAVIDKDGKILSSPLKTHAQLMEESAYDLDGGEFPPTQNFGFVTTAGRFVLQKEAQQLAQQAKQVQGNQPISGEIVSGLEREGRLNPEVDPLDGSVSEINKILREVGDQMDQGLTLQNYATRDDLPEFQSSVVDDAADFADYLANDLAPQFPKEFANRIKAAAGNIQSKPVSTDTGATNYSIGNTQFKGWFGDWENDPTTASKVVDSDGKPMVVYHGTTADMSEFTKEGSGEFGRGHYFAPRADSAAFFGGRNGESGLNIMPAYLSMKRPLRVDVAKGGRDKVRAMGQKKIRKQGYDGIIATGLTGEVQYVVFEPTQIKSATGNRGTFDPTSPNINYSIGANYSSEDKYNQIIPEISSVNPNKVSRRDMYEVAKVSPDVAANMSFEEPIEVSLFADGTLMLSDGHHRLAAAKQLGMNSIPAVVRSINAKGKHINALIAEQQPGATNYSIGIRFDEIAKEDPKHDGSRVGTAWQGKVKPTTQDTNDGIASVVPEELEKQMAMLTHFVDGVPLPKFITKHTNPKKRMRAFIDFQKGNLLALYDAFDSLSADYVIRSTHWYDGARLLAEGIRDLYGLTIEQSSSIIAVFSPMKDWFQNVAMGQRFADVMATHKKTKITKQKMSVAMEEMLNATEKEGDLRKELKEIEGKSIEQLLKDKSKVGRKRSAVAVRLMSTHVHGLSHDVLSPEGESLGIRKNKNGSNKKMVWQSYAFIEKAISIFENGSLENISKALGTEHKIRNFYNNIVAPTSPYGDATVDTHAVNAAVLYPMGGSAYLTTLNFGDAGVAGGGNSGIYWLFHEALREASAERGVMPRQMQSITWEAIRGLFTDVRKRDKKFVAAITKIWENTKDAEAARSEIIGLGITPPEWARVDSTNSGIQGGVGGNAGQEADSAGSVRSGVRQGRQAGNRGAGVSNYSIASQSEIDRVNRALGGMNRGPDERLKVYERAREKFSLLQAWNRDELQAMQETGADDTTIRRSQILQGLGELDAILSILPPEVRGRVGGYTKLASIAPMDVFKDGVKISEVSGMKGALISAWMDQGLNIGQAGKKVDFPPGYEAKENLATARADRAIADFFRDRIKKIDAEFEKVLVREYTEAITKAVKQSRPKAGDNGVRKSTLGAETQKFADTVYRATLLDDEATAKRMAEIEAAINAPDATAEDISALSEEWSILNTFGDLDNRSSETLAQGFNWLKGELQMGREAWRIKEQARIDEQRARVAATIEWLGKGTAKKRNATKTKSELASDLANHYLLSHASFEQFVTAIFPPEIAARWAEKLRKADEASQTAEIRDRKGILDAVRAGAKAANMSTAEALLWLKGDQKNAVAYLEDRKVTDERIAIDLAKKIVTGEADRSKLTDADVETLRNELAALPADTQKEFVTIKRVIFRGNDVKLDMSRGKAIQYLLSWNQPDVQIKMRKEGWTDESAADLKALVNDPVSREVMAYAKELYGKGASIVNPVYSRMFGMNMPQVKNYAPTRFLNAGDTKDIGLDGSPTATGTTPGFAKSRVTHSAKMAPEDALTVMQGHIAQQAHWVNFAELAREFRAMLSNPEVRESIKQAHGESVLKDAELWADQMEQRGGNKARESTWMNTILGTVLSGKAVSSLGFNLKTLAMQLENTIRFGLALDMKQIVSALSNPSTIVEDIQTVWESDAIQNRLQGGATAEARFLFSRYAGKPNFAAKIAEASMTPINWLDSAATSISSAIVYRANLNDALKNGMPENLAKQAAIEAASKAIYRFAQPVSFGQKSIVENNGNVLSKMFFLFMSDARLKTAIIADAARGLATGRGNASEHRRRILTVELMSVISHVISSAFRDAFSDDDDEEIWNLGGFAKAILLAPLQGFFFAGTVGELAISKLTGQKTFNSTTQNPLLSSMEQAIRAGNNLEDAINFDDPDAMLKEWNNIFRSMALSPAMAAPAVLLNMVKPALGLYQNATTEE